MWEVAYPISLILDRVLGREVSAIFSRQGLIALVKLNVESLAHSKESDVTEQVRVHTRLRGRTESQACVPS